MLLVRVYVAPSTIDGMGLFAAEFIKKGTIVRVTSSHLEKVITRAHFLNLHPATQEYVNKYAWNDEQGDFHMEFGPELFTNHSTDSNLKLEPNSDSHIAVRDIEADEEITDDYREYSHKDPTRKWLND